jgi:hypothetical protein
VRLTGSTTGGEGEVGRAIGELGIQRVDLASNLDNPEEFTEVLQRFLGRVTRPLELVDGPGSARSAAAPVRVAISPEPALSLPVAA